MKDHPREPIKHTCPEIDKYIKYIKTAIVKQRDLKYFNERELYDAASDMSNELENCIDYLESIRKSNDILRRWGIEEAGRVDELEEELFSTSNNQPEEERDKMITQPVTTKQNPRRVGPGVKT